MREVVFQKKLVCIRFIVSVTMGYVGFFYVEAKAFKI